MESRILDVEGWEKVVHFTDKETQLEAIISVHNSNLGSGLGGCRVRKYDSFEDGLTDVKRLSRGMTYKNALGHIPFGGGKAVVFADPYSEKTPEMMQAMGRAIDSLQGLYVSAQDSGVTTDDIREMRKATRNAAGVEDEQGRGGNPSPFTAYGVWQGMKAAAAHKLGSDSLKGVRVSILGLGAVGMALADYLHQEGARLVVADINDRALAAAREKFAAEVVSPEEACAQDVDIFAPCALGGSINDGTINRLKAGIIAGAANNQLQQPEFDGVLKEKGILYAPDYVINAGGVISIGHEFLGDWNRDKLYGALDNIATVLTQIFERAKAEDKPTGIIADTLAEEIFMQA
ncbi:Glu/Leu/Phe/Val dehydrogenase dimerization domain-containing protein [Parvularcula sp. IMCC14364]|uniref:Leu/Phe/Val dehydrogenase n=1 Tax=Parvularcula sp. IMCC14364 TaxID=3067902 RepID=UPI002741667E|nr:Glu/Leu/Phe/Val dehydrogenase dimerization domain-containing protein [Parvularcula sp. IMCC14364]